ncbi:hypothetical protein PYW08_010430 [Mythimna loreyi]|uniref:Uncharacterized protein n=1 Tax=Mythimna loreyi TaxID=667449 RepID=A0ACC2Q4I6_9NEOP|nr:hypothetical protein PYW08_010430 [Mythimna loreyi]
MPSLLKSLYDDEANIPEKSIQHSTKNNNYTMTENDPNINKVITSNAEVSTAVINDIGIKQRKTEKFLPEDNDSKPIVVDRTKLSNLDLPKNSRINIKHNHKKISNRGKINKFRKRAIFQSTHNKKFTLLYNKANNQKSRGEDFLKHCQSIIQYFEDYKNKNIKLNVQINVYSKSECETKDVCTDVSNQTLGVYDIKFNPTLLYNMQSTKVDASVHMDEEPDKYKTETEKCSSEFCPEIIPLLDSSVCQAKFIFNVNSKEKEIMPQNNSLIERSTLTSELEIVQEISELRAVIRDLAAAAERFVSEQLKRESNKSNAETTISRNPSNYTSSSKVEAVINLRNPSKAIQYSKEIVEKQKLLSGLKITKEPKKREMFDFYNRLAKKSTSYRIIDSESILRVTDMTSKANELNELSNNRDRPDMRSSRVTRLTDEAVYRSLQKSKSLFEITSEQTKKRKITTLFHDQKNPQCRVCSINHNLTPTTCSEKSCRQLRKLFARTKKKAEEDHERPIGEGKLPPCICGSDTNFTSLQFISMPMLNPDPEPRGTTPRNNYSLAARLPDEPEEKVCMRDLGDDEEAALVCSSSTKSCLSADEDPVEMRLQKCYKERRGMGFGEGLVYCVLLWIPILLLGCLFYAYVLRDTLQSAEDAVDSEYQITPLQPIPVKPPTQAPTLAPIRHNQSSILTLKLSDLGF